MFVGYAIRTVVCDECGRKMTGRYKPSPPWRCFECGMARLVGTIERQHAKTGPEYEIATAKGIEVGLQVKARKGPYYERWRAGMLASVGGDPLLPEDPNSDDE